MSDSQPKVSKREHHSHRQNTTKTESKSDLKNEENKGQMSSRSSRKHNTGRNKSGRSRRRDRSGRRNEDSSVKLILRLLPPNLSKTQFIEALEPQFGDLTQWDILEWYYVQGHYPSNLRTNPTYSRCYFVFNTMESLHKFAKKVQPIKFVDDKDNATNASMKVSAYVRRFAPEPQGSQPLEGTIAEDALFQIFMNSLKILQEKKSGYSFADISILKPLEKELAKQKALELEIQKKTENAIVALTGDNSKKKKEKEKKKNKKKDKKSKDNAGKFQEITNSANEASSSRKRKRSKKKKKRAEMSKNGENNPKEPEKNNNVVILEAAGRRELQRRRKLQLEKENPSQRKEDIPKPKTKSKRKPRSKGKPNDSKAQPSADDQNAFKLKILKREIAE